MIALETSRNHAAVVEAAARSLLSVSHESDTSLITLPLFYPSGAAVVVEVVGGRDSFFVNDGGRAYREVEMFGGEHLFGRNSSQIAESFSIDASKRSFSAFASIEQLAATIADVGDASVQLASRICERIAVRHETAIASGFYRKLVQVFGQDRVVQDATIEGASSHQWKISALVHADGREIAFEAVSNHHSSVYSSATMFHDIALLSRKPVPIAVVRNKTEMGAYLGILSQAANVIEADASNNTIERLAA